MEKVTISSPLVSTNGYLGPVNAVALLIVVFIWLYIIYKQTQGLVLDIPAESFVFRDFKELNYYYGGSNNNFVRLTGVGGTEELKEANTVVKSFLNFTPVDDEMVQIGNEVYLNSEGTNNIVLPADQLSNEYNSCKFGAEETRLQLCALGKGDKVFDSLPVLSTFEIFSESQLAQRAAQRCIIGKAREFYEDKEYEPPTGLAYAWAPIPRFFFKSSIRREVTIDGEVVAFKAFDSLDCIKGFNGFNV